jgi:hypothetical protein
MRQQIILPRRSRFRLEGLLIELSPDGVKLGGSIVSPYGGGL